MTTKKHTGMKNKPNHGVNNIKKRREKPNEVFVEWLSKEVKAVKPGDTIHFSFDKLMASVFAPAKITESSAYLFVNRLVQGRCVQVKAMGKVLNMGGKGNSFVFVPHRKAAPTTNPVPPVPGNPPAHPLHDLECRIKNIESISNLILVGLNSMMKELGVSATPKG